MSNNATFQPETAQSDSPRERYPFQISSVPSPRESKTYGDIAGAMHAFIHRSAEIVCPRSQTYRDAWQGEHFPPNGVYPTRTGLIGTMNDGGGIPAAFKYEIPIRTTEGETKKVIFFLFRGGHWSRSPYSSTGSNDFHRAIPSELMVRTDPSPDVPLEQVDTIRMLLPTYYDDHLVDAIQRVFYEYRSFVDSKKDQTLGEKFTQILDAYSACVVRLYTKASSQRDCRNGTVVWARNLIDEQKTMVEQMKSLLSVVEPDWDYVVPEPAPPSAYTGGQGRTRKDGYKVINLTQSMIRADWEAYVNARVDLLNGSILSKINTYLAERSAREAAEQAAKQEAQEEEVTSLAPVDPNPIQPISNFSMNHIEEVLEWLEWFGSSNASTSVLGLKLSAINNGEVLSQAFHALNQFFNIADTKPFTEYTGLREERYLQYLDDSLRGLKEKLQRLPELCGNLSGVVYRDQFPLSLTDPFLSFLNVAVEAAKQSFQDSQRHTSGQEPNLLQEIYDQEWNALRRSFIEQIPREVRNEETKTILRLTDALKRRLYTTVNVTRNKNGYNDWKLRKPLDYSGDYQSHQTASYRELSVLIRGEQTAIWARSRPHLYQSSLSSGISGFLRSRIRLDENGSIRTSQGVHHDPHNARILKLAGIRLLNRTPDGVDGVSTSIGDYSARVVNHEVLGVKFRTLCIGCHEFTEAHFRRVAAKWDTLNANRTKGTDNQTVEGTEENESIEE